MARKTTSLAEQAYQTIKNRILDLTYAPGMSLTEAMLTEDLGMSRSPVRAAIQMLQAEGLLVSDYYRSITVREITDKDIRDIYQLRELLEGAAFQLIFTSGRHEEYSYRFEEKVVRMCAAASDPYAWEVADTDMHLRSSGSWTTTASTVSTKTTSPSRSASASTLSVTVCGSPRPMNG